MILFRALRRSTLLLFGLLLVPTPGRAQSTPPRSAASARGPNLERFDTDGLKSVVVVPGRRYQAGGLKSFLLGSQYRDLWNTPIRVDVLDLRTYAGGLTPVRAGGGTQSLALHMMGADGRSYVFRTVDKELTVPAGYENTFAESLMQDMTVKAFHPGAAMVVSPLVEAVGLLHAEPTLVVMPHDPALGEFYDVYSGLVGIIEERPDEEADDAPGFAGSSNIVATEQVLERVEESHLHRVDQWDYLKARLMDILLGDLNRDTDNWRWARFDRDGGYIWRPIPRDRDEAFVAHDGLLWSIYRLSNPRFQRFGVEYGSALGITESAWELDRQLLSELNAPAWDSVAGLIQEALTDAVIDDAVAHMPPELHRIDGAQLAEALKHRRDGLPAKAREFYNKLAEAPDVRATDEDDLAVIRHAGDGSVEVNLYADARAEGDGQAYYRRRFLPGETSEVRVYLRGGDDRAVVRGARGTIEVRVIGGDGGDILADSTTGRGAQTQFHDAWGENEFVTQRGTHVNTRRFRPGPSTGTGPPFVLDWGSSRGPAFLIDYDGDVGPTLGLGISDTKYGFRKAPYDRRLLARAGAAASGRVRLDLEAHFVDVKPGVDLQISAGLSGVQAARFHGFGNNTEIGEIDEFYEVKRYDFWVEPALAIKPAAGMVLSTGPVLRVTATPEEGNTLINRARPYALGGDFFEAGWQVVFDADRRDSQVWPTKGARLSVEARAFPSVIDVEGAFATLSAEASTYLSTTIPTRMTLALRVGGKQTWGRTPYHEAAYLGGRHDLRGFRRDRFVGDASLFGGAELRIPVGKATLLTFPAEWGVLALADVGRVYLEDEQSGRWHSALGGGIWVRPLNLALSLNLSIAFSDERTEVYQGFRLSF